MAFKGRKKIWLNTPQRVREEAGRAYKAWIAQEIDDDGLKTAIYSLDKIGSMMRGAELEHLITELKSALAASDVSLPSMADVRAHARAIGRSRTH